MIIGFSMFWSFSFSTFYYDNQNIKKNIEIDFRCSDFTYGVKKDHKITYGYQGLWGPGGLG